MSARDAGASQATSDSSNPPSDGSTSTSTETGQTTSSPSSGDGTQAPAGDAKPGDTSAESTTKTPATPTSDVNPNRLCVSASPITISGNQASVTFTIGVGCSDIPVSLGSYTTGRPGFSLAQTLFAKTGGVFSTGGPFSLSVAVPNCFFQVDLTWVTETSLSTALNVSYMAEKTATFGIVVGIALLLAGLGFAILAIGGALRNPELGFGLSHRHGSDAEKTPVPVS